MKPREPRASAAGRWARSGASFLAGGAILLPLILAACGSIAPPATPRQLANTPGPFVTLADGVYHAGVFSVRYPAGWRIVTSAASQPPAVIFVRPDDAALIIFSAAPVEPMPRPGGGDPVVVVSRTLTPSQTVTVYAALAAPETGWEASLELFERLTASLEAGQSHTP